MNYFKTTILMALMMGLFLFVGSILGGQNGMMIAFVVALGINFFSYWFSDKIVLKLYRATPITREQAPAVYDMVEELTQKASLPMPKVCIIENNSPNAFATGRNPEHSAVALTTGILGILTKDEIQGVVAHELAHIKNRDTLISTIAASFAGGISMLARIAGYAAMFGGRDEDNKNVFYSLAMMILAPLIAMIIQMSISRSREYAADATGAAICGKPLSLASALEKLTKVSEVRPMEEASPASAHMFIVNPLSGRSLMSLFSTHPPIPERVKRLQEIAAGRR